MHVPGVGNLQAHILPGLDSSLLSISAFVQLGLKVTFDNEYVRLLRDSDDVEVLRGKRDDVSGLWSINLADLQNQCLPPSTNESTVEDIVPLTAFASTTTNSMLSASPAVRLTTADDTINFWHRTFGSPSTSTFIDAISKGWVQIPGVTANLVRRHPPNPVETSLGHLHSTRQGIRSTKIQDPNVLRSTALNASQEPNNPQIFSTVYECTGRIYSDAAGRFPIKSLHNKQYMIIFFSEDTNYIHIETVCSRSGPELLAAFQRAVTFFSKRNCPINFARMDNECSAATREWAESEHIAIELVPPGKHRTNDPNLEVSFHFNSCRC